MMFAGSVFVSWKLDVMQGPVFINFPMKEAVVVVVVVVQVQEPSPATGCNILPIL